jgi:hypothetical protein
LEIFPKNSIFPHFSPFLHIFALILAFIEGFFGRFGLFGEDSGFQTVADGHYVGVMGHGAADAAQWLT